MSGTFNNPAYGGLAFESAMFIMDFLKSNAPFWKKENGKAESKWVQARDVDAKALQRWSV